MLINDLKPTDTSAANQPLSFPDVPIRIKAVSVAQILFAMCPWQIRWDMDNQIATIEQAGQLKPFSLNDFMEIWDRTLESLSGASQPYGPLRALGEMTDWPHAVGYYAGVLSGITDRMRQVDDLAPIYQEYVQLFRSRTERRRAKAQ